MTIQRSTWVLFLVSFLLLAVPGVAQEDDDWGEELPCDGVLADAELLAATLARVPKYDTTYVLVFRDEIADQVVALDAPALRQGELSLAVYGDSPAAALAAENGLQAQTYPFEPANAGKILQDVLAGDLDAGLMWAPLAGLAALELDFNYEVSLRTASSPRPAPAAFSGAAEAAAPSTCADEVESLLGGYSVVPADKLVQLDIRDFLHLAPPPRDLAAARRGSELYAEHCAKCHGPEAVAATDALAPVDLLISTPRFSFPGFLYIVLNGRSQNGMPGFNGSLSQDEVRLIYQYARERSHGVTDLSSK